MYVSMYTVAVILFTAAVYIQKRTIQNYKTRVGMSSDLENMRRIRMTNVCMERRLFTVLERIVC